MRRWSDRKSLATTLAFNLVKGIRDVAAGIAVGLTLVCVGQVLLQTLFAMTSDDTVFRLEDGIVTARFGLGWVLNFYHLLTVALVFLLASILWPMAETLAQYKSWRTWTSRGLIVLTTLSAFTFFTSTAIAAVERTWVAGRRAVLQEDAERIRQGRQALIKSAYVKRVLDLLSDTTKSEIREFFSAASKASDGSSIVHELANRLGRRMPSFASESTPGPARAESSRQPTKTQTDGNEGKVPTGTTVDRSTESIEARRATNDAVENVETWTKKESRQQTDAVSFEDAHRVVAEASRVDASVQTAQMVLEDAVRTIISSQLPTTMDPLVSQFVRSLLNSSVQTFAEGTVASAVSTYADAMTWVSTHLESPAAIERWSWYVGTIDDYRPKPSLDVAQTVPNTEPSYTDLFANSGESQRSLEDLRRGLESGWVVTQNAAGKIFVHRERYGQALIGLRYLIDEGFGGQWTVYTPTADGLGGQKFGRRIGTIEKPRGVEVTACTCR